MSHDRVFRRDGFRDVCECQAGPQTSIDSKRSIRECLTQATSFWSSESGAPHLVAIVGCTCAIAHEVPRVRVRRREKQRCRRAIHRPCQPMLTG